MEEALSKGSDASASVRAKALLEAGRLAKFQSDYDRAIRLIEESLAVYREIGSKMISYSLGSLGLAVLRQGDYEQSVKLFEEGLALAREVGGKYDRNVAAVRAGLGEEVFAKVWEAGRKMTVEEAVEYALMT